MSADSPVEPIRTPGSDAAAERDARGENREREQRDRGEAHPPRGEPGAATRSHARRPDAVPTVTAAVAAHCMHISVRAYVQSNAPDLHLGATLVPRQIEPPNALGAKGLALQGLLEG
jgi:hypothetical protein